MPERDIKILFVGDMHLGRLPSRVPDGVPGGDIPPREELGPGAAWLRTAQEAVRLGVDAVALAGDVVHGDNDIFEGAGELDAGLEHLRRAGIAVVAVAGNHDMRVLPDLAERRDFHLLGRGGTWGEHVIQRGEALAVRIVGWSFPEPHWSSSPLAQTPPAPRSDLITLGLLHADLDATGSVFAPVGSTALSAVGYDGWCLGHIHRPDPVPRDATPFYLGSLTGLDPSETGRHGPVLVTVDERGLITRRRLALAPLRWEHLVLDAAAVTDPAAELTAAVHAAVEDLAVGLADELTHTRVLGVRVQVSGEVADPSSFAPVVVKLNERPRSLSAGGTVVFVDKILSDVRARRDLLGLARQADPAGLLARHILTLEGVTTVPGVADSEQLRRRLLRTARARLTVIDREDAFRHVAAAMDDEGVRQLTLRTAHDLLEHLLSSRGDRHAAEQA